MTLGTPGDEPRLQEPPRALGTPRDPPMNSCPPPIGVPRCVTHWRRGRWPWSRSGSSEGTRGHPARPWWPRRSPRWPRQSPAGGQSPGGRTPAPGASRGCARTLRGQRHGGTACGGDTTPRGQRQVAPAGGGDKNPPATVRPPRTLFGALRGVAHGQAELSPAEGGDSDMRGGPGDTVQRLGHVGRPLQQHVLGTRQRCHRERVALLGDTCGSVSPLSVILVVSPCNVTLQCHSTE